jgi:hypothetical protein
MIAVLGDTSIGKFSLSSSFPLVELPISDQLTTRCPIMLKMNRSDTKSTAVKVVWKEAPADRAASQIAFMLESFDESNRDGLTANIGRAQEHIVEQRICP